MITFIKSATREEDFPQYEKEIVFVGRSNVGKSSLINALYLQNIAYVGKKPGKTRMINFFDVNGTYLAVDVPGYGFAKRSKLEAIEFDKMMNQYFKRQDSIKLVILISDVRIGLSEDDKQMLEFIKERGFKYKIIANKSDKLSNNQLTNAKFKLYKDYPNTLFISTTNKKGISELKDYIDSILV